MTLSVAPPLALHIQPACLEHKYIRHKDSSHIFERPERLRAVLLGFAAALARLEAADGPTSRSDGGDDLSSMLSSLSLASAFLPPTHLSVVLPPPLPSVPGQVLLHHPALQLAHSPPIDAPFPYLPRGTSGAALPQSAYLKDLFKWASEAVEMIRTTGCEIPQDKGLNAGDLYLGPGSVIAIEGAVQTVCQAVDGVCSGLGPATAKPEPEVEAGPSKAFCAIRPPGHHCGEDEPSGFCYVNNVVVGAMHAYLQHDIDRAIIIDFDLHHGNGTQALVMPLNAAAYAEDLAVKAGKPPSDMRGRNGPRRTWQGFYGSVHDIYSYPCEDGDLDLIREASVNLAAHGQYIENIHLQPYANEADFYTRIYPLYLALLDKARVFMKDTSADPARTMLFISAGFDACEHEHQGMQRHDRRVPASFYARYTKDIAEFADAHTGGKVISVLEGGYGDRALTSAALGHAVGLMGREGAPEWWSVPELELLERAVKKRRKGRLCALPPDLATRPHIARTHALLSHFEAEAAPRITPAPSAAPSTNATPSTNQRMTLRERRPKLEVEDESPRPAPRRRQPKSNAAELERERETSPTPTPTPTPQAARVPVLVKPSLPIDPANVYPSPTPSAPSPEDAPSADGAQDALQAPRVILRIPARTPPPPESVNDEAPSTPVPAPKAPASIPAADSKPKPPAQAPQQLQSQPQPKPVVQPNSFRPIAPQAVALPPSQPRSSASAASGEPSDGQGMRGPLPILSPMPTSSHTSQPPQYFAPPQPYQHHEAFAPAHHAPPMPGWAAPPQAFGLYPTLPREASPPPHNPPASSFPHQNVPPQQFSNGHDRPSLMSHANFRPSDMHSPHQPAYPVWPQQEGLYGVAAQNLGTPGAPPQSQSQSQSQAQSHSTQNAPPKRA